MNEEIGSTAGEIWKFLIDNGPSTIIKIKSALEIPNTQIYLALGWLAREDKIVFIKKQHSFEISLK
jgi:hypothetical protein